MATKRVVTLILTAHLFVLVFSRQSLAQTLGQDATPPELISASYPTDTIDARTQNQTVSGLQAVALDPPGNGVASGVNQAYIVFETPSCTQSTDSLDAYFYPQGTFTPGQSQTLPGYMSVYTTSVSGTYYPCYASISDEVGNNQYYDSTTTLIQSLPSLPVLGNGPPPPQDPPVLTGFSISPGSADVSASSQTFTATLTATDTGSGVNPYNSYVDLCSPTHCWGSNSLGPLSLQAGGTPASGTWTAQIQIPRYSVAGSWTISVRLCDTEYNCQYYASNDLSTADFASMVSVTDSSPDTTPPQLKSITLTQYNETLTTNLISPATGAASNLITVTLVFNNDLSGIGYDGYSGCTPYMYALSQNQFPLDPTKSTVQLAYASFSQDPSSQSVFTGNLYMPYLSEIGTWTVQVQTCDRVGNNSYFSGPASALGQQGAFLYVLQSTSTSPVPIPSAGSPLTITDPSGASVTLNAGAPIVSEATGMPITSPGITVTATPGPSASTCTDANNCAATPVYQGYQATTSPYVSVTFYDSSGTAVNGVTTASPGATITIPGVVPAGNPAGVDVSTLILFSIDNGVNSAATPCLGSNTEGLPFNPVLNGDGSVTYSNVCRFSTFYVLQRSGIPGDLNNDGAVDCADFAIVHASLGKSEGQTGFDSRADVNLDGIVDVLDLSFASRLLPAGAVCH